MTVTKPPTVTESELRSCPDAAIRLAIYAGQVDVVDDSGAVVAVLGVPKAPAEPAEDRTQPPPGYWWHYYGDGSVSTTHVAPDITGIACALATAWARHDTITAPFRERAERAEAALARAVEVARREGFAEHEHRLEKAELARENWRRLYGERNADARKAERERDEALTRGRAEERAAVVAWWQSDESATELHGFVEEVRDGLHVRDGADALARLLREAAAAELERAAKCSCARLDGEGVVSVSFLRDRAAALRSGPKPGEGE